MLNLELDFEGQIYHRQLLRFRSLLLQITQTSQPSVLMASSAELRLLNQNKRIIWAQVCPISNRYSCAHRAQNFWAQNGHKHAEKNKQILDRED